MASSTAPAVEPRSTLGGPEAPPPPPPRAAGDRARGSFRLGSIFGLEIVLDWSLVIIVALITFGLGNGVLAAWHPEWGAALRWTVAVVAAVLFIASILVHELSHALIGRMQGIPFRRITLFVFGGMAQMEGEPPSPRAELTMAIVGPLTSLAIGAAATAAGVLLGTGSIALMTLDPAAAARALSPTATLLLWIGPVNLMLGVFNLVPGFPLDGGRVLRAAIWWATGDALAATRRAAAVGQGFALVLMGLGVLYLLGGGLVQGVWFLLIGWFVNNAARQSLDQMLMRHMLSDVRVADVMRTHFETVGPDTRIRDLVEEHIIRTDQQAFPVVSDGGLLLGLVCLDDVRRAPREEWDAPVATIMTRFERLHTARPEAKALTALQALASLGVQQLPVVDGSRLLGLVRRRDVLKWMSLHAEQALGAPPDAAAFRAAPRESG